MMLSRDEEQALSSLADQLSREDPELARKLSPFHPRKQPGWTWLSWVMVYMVVLPWAFMALYLEPVAAIVLVSAPPVIGVLVRGRRLVRERRSSRSRALRSPRSARSSR